MVLQHVADELLDSETKESDPDLHINGLHNYEVRSVSPRGIKRYAPTPSNGWLHNATAVLYVKYKLSSDVLTTEKRTDRQEANRQTMPSLNAIYSYHGLIKNTKVRTRIPSQIFIAG